MKHIKQKETENNILPVIYTVVNTDDWTGELEDHPSIIEHPELFEIVDSDIPENHQFLIYTS